MRLWNYVINTVSLQQVLESIVFLGAITGCFCVVFVFNYISSPLCSRLAAASITALFWGTFGWCWVMVGAGTLLLPPWIRVKPFTISYITFVLVVTAICIIHN